MTIAFEEGFFRTTSNKFILEANLPSMKGVVETWEGMAKEVGHQVSRNEGWPSQSPPRDKNYSDTLRSDSPLLSFRQPLLSAG